jgi:putative transposase
MDSSQLQRLWELEAENARLKKIVAQQVLDNDALKDLLGVSPSARRKGVEYRLTNRQYSQRRACRLVGIARSSARYVPKRAPDEAALTAAIHDQAHRRPSYGYRRVTVMLKRAGWTVNHQRVHRLWRVAGLQLPRRKVFKRRVGQANEPLKRAESPNHVWTYDFMAATTERGGKLRIL